MSKKPNDEVDGFAPGCRPICGFCNTPWSDDMMAVFAEAEEEGDYYGGSYVVGIDCAVDVTCGSCKRVIYRKEYRVANRTWSDGSASE